MVQIVNFQGTDHQFPDNAKPEDIQKSLESLKIGKLESAAMGVKSGAANLVGSALQSVGNIPGIQRIIQGANPYDTQTPVDYQGSVNQMMGEVKRETAPFKKANPWSFGIPEFATQAAPFLAAAPETILGNTLLGGAMGLTQYTPNNNDHIFNAGISGVLTGGVTGALKGLGATAYSVLQTTKYDKNKSKLLDEINTRNQELNNLGQESKDLNVISDLLNENKKVAKNNITAINKTIDQSVGKSVPATERKNLQDGFNNNIKELVKIRLLEDNIDSQIKNVNKKISAIEELPPVKELNNQGTEFVSALLKRSGNVENKNGPFNPFIDDHQPIIGDLVPLTKKVTEIAASGPMTAALQVADLVSGGGLAVLPLMAYTTKKLLKEGKLPGVSKDTFSVPTIDFEKAIQNTPMYSGPGVFENTLSPMAAQLLNLETQKRIND